MGVYLNPGNKGFQESICSEIYVDKTGLIKWTNKYLNTEQKFICVSRPRRFGKSMALKMLAAYYDCDCDSSGLFAGLKIENDPTFLKNLNKYNVIYLNMQQFLIESENLEITKYLEREVMRELEADYKEFLTGEEVGLASMLRQIYAKTGQTFIFLIDEWDCVMRERQESEDLQKQYLDFLRNPSNLDYNNEFAMSCVVILAYWSARKDYKIIREMPAGYGYADIVFLPLPRRNKPAIVVELKYNQTAQTAISQIKDKKYIDALKDYMGDVILVGINYNKDKKKEGHSCKIECVKYLKNSK